MELRLSCTNPKCRLPSSNLGVFRVVFTVFSGACRWLAPVLVAVYRTEAVSTSRRHHVCRTPGLATGTPAHQAAYNASSHKHHTDTHETRFVESNRWNEAYQFIIVATKGTCYQKNIKYPSWNWFRRIINKIHFKKVICYLWWWAFLHTQQPQSYVHESLVRQELIPVEPQIKDPWKLSYLNRFLTCRWLWHITPDVV